LNTATGEVAIANFVPAQNLSSPEGATHVSLESGFLNLDFSTNAKDLQLSPVFNTPIDNTVTPIVLTPAAVPTGTGNQLYFLKVSFFQQVNGVQYALNNGAFNALMLIDLL
jgi:hypothetical protein